MGFMAKRVSPPPGWIGAPGLVDVCSVSNCVSDDFADYILMLKHNGHWFFNSPSDIQELARTHTIDLEGTRLFYYEAYPTQFDGASWKPFELKGAQETDVVPPSQCERIGFDVVTYSHGNSPQCPRYRVTAWPLRYRRMFIVSLNRSVKLSSVWRTERSSELNLALIASSRCTPFSGPSIPLK